jgi:hypothetical protein
MESRNSVRPEVSSTSGSGPATPGATIVGWVLLCFALIPLSMAAHGDGRVYVTTGLVMFAAGFALVVMARLLNRRGGGRGPTPAAG